MGSSPVRRTSVHGPLAQQVEQLTLNQRVAGSIPARLTRFDAPESRGGRALGTPVSGESGGTVDAPDLGSGGVSPWGFKSLLSHQVEER